MSLSKCESEWNSAFDKLRLKRNFTFWTAPAVSVVLVFKRVAPSVFYPLAILGAVDRLALYLGGVLPSDERSLAQLLGWNIHSFKYIFLSAEIVLLALVVVSFIRFRLSIKHSVFIFIIPLVSFVVGALIGVFVVERYIFPDQFMIQFH